jgi:hypothetical protein
MNISGTNNKHHQLTKYPVSSHLRNFVMKWIEIAYYFLEYLAVAIIVGMAVYSTIRFFSHIVTKKNSPEETFAIINIRWGQGSFWDWKYW